jgi:hypothetical protein
MTVRHSEQTWESARGVVRVRRAAFVGSIGEKSVKENISIRSSSGRMWMGVVVRTGEDSQVEGPEDDMLLVGE